MLKFRNFFKLTLLTLASAFFLSGCANINLISAVGSSSVQPLLNKLSSYYVLNENNDNDKLVEVSVQAGGSNAGIRAIINGFADIGNVSKNPKEYAKENEKKWRDKKLKTLTIGKDAIAVIYKAPQELKGKLLLTKDNINDLYDLFAGVKTINIDKFVKKDTKNMSNEKDYPLTSFPRTGGSFASGTAEAFLNFSALKSDKTLDSQTRDILKGIINYGPLAKPTSETNIEAFNTFVTNLQDPNLFGMIYLSLGFIQNNLQAIKNNGFEILPIKYENKEVLPSNQTVSQNEYKWVRPLNSIVSLSEENKNIDEIKTFFNWLFFNGKKDVIKNIYDEFGILQLTEDEKKKMFKTNDSSPMNLENFWVDDFAFSNPIFGAF